MNTIIDYHGIEKERSYEMVISHMRYIPPTDEIYIHEKDVDELEKCTAEVFGSDEWDESLIIRGRTIPLYDFETAIKTDRGVAYTRLFIDQDTLNDTVTDVENGTFPKDMFAIIGGVQMLDRKLFIPMLVDRRLKLCFDKCFYDMSGNKIKDPFKEYSTDLQTVAGGLISQWDIFQIALLNPQTAELFSKPTVIKERGKKNRRQKQERRITKYVRHHAINEGEVEALRNESRQFERKCKAWYVIGHYRHYKNGKTVFVNPYWKGELRALKQNLDGGRTRLISKPEIGVKLS